MAASSAPAAEEISRPWTDARTSAGQLSNLNRDSTQPLLRFILAATLDTSSPNEPYNRRHAAASSTGDKSSRSQFSAAPITTSSSASPSTRTAGNRNHPKSRTASVRRCPHTTSYRPPTARSPGRCIRPRAAIERLNSSNFSGSSDKRNCSAGPSTSSRGTSTCGKAPRTRSNNPLDSTTPITLHLPGHKAPAARIPRPPNRPRNPHHHPTTRTRRRPHKPRTNQDTLSTHVTPPRAPPETRTRHLSDCTPTAASCLSVSSA